jgi:8-oxo-dGTP pyrophosphatase MutT (NUDIX family)
MEEGEDLVEAVTREVEEETGLTVDVAGPCYGYLTFYKGERLLAVSMACRPAGDADAIRLEPGDADNWLWATQAEWESLAERDQSSWDLKDLRKATRAMVAVWEAEEG